jgi:hypothetical protein
MEIDIQYAFRGIKDVILKELESATSEILVAVAWFTNNELFEALCQKAEQGLNIKLIIIDDYINNRLDGLPFQKLIDNGAQLFFGRSTTPMHNKFCIIDNKVITGSYNWTYYAEYKNNENIVIIEDSNLLKSYKEEFSRLSKLSDLITIVTPNQYLLSEIMDCSSYLAQDYVSYSQEMLDSGKKSTAAALVQKASLLQPESEIIKKARIDIFDNLRQNWNKEYDIVKLRIETDRTIIQFKTQMENCTFYGPNHPQAWFLRDSDNPNDIYRTIAIRNLRMNNSEKTRELIDNEEQNFNFSGLSSQRFNCEIHFPAISEKVKFIDLIEGGGNELNELSWNFFRYQITP